MRLPNTPAKVQAPVVEPAPAVEPESEGGDSWDNWDDKTDTPWQLGPNAEPIEPAGVQVEGRPTYRERFVPSPEDVAAAAVMFADRRHSCLEGESGPPIGDKGWPRKSAPRRYTGTGIGDQDIYRPGGYS